MGNCQRPSGRKRQPQKCLTLAILGVDNAGKTTACKSFSGEAVDKGVVPTVGFSNIKFTFEAFDIALYDVGGGKNIRSMWKEYFPEVHGFIYVVDASSAERMDEARETFRDTLEHPHVSGKPVLLLANKQDNPEALDEVNLCKQLNLKSVVNINKCPCHVDPCSAIKGSGQRIDSHMKEGLRWLTQTIDAQWEDISTRVQRDMKAAQEVRLAENHARRERVQKLREERERQEVEEQARLGIVKKDNEEEGEETLNGDPFKPLDLEQLKEKEETLKAEKKRRKKLGASRKGQNIQDDDPASTSPLSDHDVTTNNNNIDKVSVSGMGRTHPSPLPSLEPQFGTPVMVSGRRKKRKQRKRSGVSGHEESEHNVDDEEDNIAGSPRSSYEPSRWKSTMTLSDIPVSSSDPHWSGKNGTSLPRVDGDGRMDAVSPRVRKVKKNRLRDLGAKLRRQQTAGIEGDAEMYPTSPQGPQSFGSLDGRDFPDAARSSYEVVEGRVERRKPLMVNGQGGYSGREIYQLSPGRANSKETAHQTSLTDVDSFGAKVPQHARQQGASSIQPDRSDNRTWGMADDLPPVDGDTFISRSQPNFHHEDDFLL
ncbi:hypothetical protein ACOMHN_044072 [Nucella lapillus]